MFTVLRRISVAICQSAGHCEYLSRNYANSAALGSRLFSARAVSTTSLTNLTKSIQRVKAIKGLSRAGRKNSALKLVKHFEEKMADISGSGAEPIFKEQNFDYFLVLDFEATCDDKVQVDPQEIIEFPVLKVNAKTFEVESTFHQYVEPRVHKQLSPFCVELTGIIQDMVDGQQHLEAVLGDFQKWMQDEGLLNEGVKFIFVTCGDWDLKKMLPSQAKYFDIAYPDHMKSWINIKRPFTDVVGQYPKNDMMEMLQKLNIAHTGRHHSGIDDCKNIAKILRGIALKGYCFRCTLSL